MIEAGDTRIAGKKTCDDWQSFKTNLVPGCDVGIWQEAANGYFYKRLDSRYLKPIQILEVCGSLQGEGFSIISWRFSIA